MVWSLLLRVVIYELEGVFIRQKLVSPQMAGEEI
jgi:hypothetical protein